MTKDTYRQGSSDTGMPPRQAQPDWQRRYVNGPIRPMHRPGLLARVFKIISGDA